MMAAYNFSTSASENPVVTTVAQFLFENEKIRDTTETPREWNAGRVFRYLVSENSDRMIPCTEKYSWMTVIADSGQIYCNSTWDELLCWPTTPAGETAYLPCPGVIYGVEYDTSRNASKMCFPNGSWFGKTNFSDCIQMDNVEYEMFQQLHDVVTRGIYYIGYSVSSVALIVALSIFIHFRSLHCLRNIIHCHLIISFILRNCTWLLMNLVVPLAINDAENQTKQNSCKFLVTLFNYFQVTNFFWMFVEGLYLLMMIVFAFSISKIKLWHYVLIGWGIPIAIVLTWALVKWLYEDLLCWLTMHDSYYDLVYMVPALLVLCLNFGFLVTIVRVLITKLRASTSVQARHYKKAVKALFILIPLLGSTYLIFITPVGDDRISRTIFSYSNAIIQSTQGLVVSVFFCFLNGEVKSVVKTRLNRWRQHRTLIATRMTPGSFSIAPEQVSLTGDSMQRPRLSANGRPGTPPIKREYQIVKPPRRYSNKDDNVNALRVSMEAL